MSVAHFVAAQRTEHGIPHATTCRALGVSASWFYKWRDRDPTPRQARRSDLDAAVRQSFDTSGGRYGSPRVLADLRAAGWRVAKKSVEASMARQGLVARRRRRRRCLTRPDKAAPRIPDLVKRDFTAVTINRKWCGDLTEVPTGEGKLYLATVEDLASRRIIGFGLGEHHDTELATRAIKMAVAVRGGVGRHRVPQRPRWRVQRGPVRRGLQALRDQPVDGPSRVVLRQRRGGVVLLDPGVGAVPSHPAGHQAGRPSGGRLVHRLVQPCPSTQRLRPEATARVRGDPRRPSGRIIR